MERKRPARSLWQRQTLSTKGWSDDRSLKTRNKPQLPSINATLSQGRGGFASSDTATQTFLGQMTAGCCGTVLAVYPPHPEEGASTCASEERYRRVAPVSKDGAASWFETPC